ncbi:hypothetical protein WH50_01490 [Pokkaliibacter plantistimulans]|uniref:Racemase n=1 Tax=Pokkaliibacter plantistimulans TaxID=1635171 RepID=A0ABX5M5I6_9GAMM|nr:amino acid racemase [Pokkaliibacter plantistimulans]PXF32958.1 hypothetical protein WH50_01490 [Pokkaliibacter plantistimulans]
MRTLGILGGMSWESTQVYYQGLNRGVREARGGLSSAPLLLHSLEFSQLARWQHEGNWQAIATTLGQAGQGLQAAGAQALVIATNTMHKVAGQVQSMLDIPLLHIGDAIGQRLQQQGIGRAALLGTRFTMEDGFYQAFFSEHYGIELCVPAAAERQEVHRIIFEELCQGMMLEESRYRLDRCLAELADSGAEMGILGCTELGLILPKSAYLPLLDTTAAHIQQGLAFMLDLPRVAHS